MEQFTEGTKVYSGHEYLMWPCVSYYVIPAIGCLLVERYFYEVYDEDDLVGGPSLRDAIGRSYG